MRTRSPRVSLLLLIVALAAFGGAQSSLADGADEVRLGIAPLEYTGQYFDLTMSPGESRALKVEVANHGAKEIAARTYAADAYSIINGGFGARLDGEPATGTTLWLAYAPQTIDLPAGQGLTRPFTVTVPADAGPGEYITSLAVQNAEPTAAGSGGVAIKQVQRQVIAVAITVPGPRNPALTIGSFEHKYLSAKSIVSATLTNTGNVRLKPSGELVVSEKDGPEISRVPITMDSVYAGDTTSIEVPFETALLPGDYRVTLTLNYEAGTASAVDAPLNVPEATVAEAAGAPTGAGTFATIDQNQPAAKAGLASPLVVVAGGAALTLFVALTAALIIVRRRRRSSVAPGPTDLDLTWPGGPAAILPAGLAQADASRAAIRPESVPPPPSLSPAFAHAAGDRNNAPPRPALRAAGSSRRPSPSAPRFTDAQLPTQQPTDTRATRGGRATEPARRAARHGADSPRPWLLALAATGGGLALYLHGLHARHNGRNSKA